MVCVAGAVLIRWVGWSVVWVVGPATGRIDDRSMRRLVVVPRARQDVGGAMIAAGGVIGFR